MLVKTSIHWKQNHNFISPLLSFICFRDNNYIWPWNWRVRPYFIFLWCLVGVNSLCVLICNMGVCVCGREKRKGAWVEYLHRKIQFYMEVPCKDRTWTGDSLTETSDLEYENLSISLSLSLSPSLSIHLSLSLSLSPFRSLTLSLLPRSKLYPWVLFSAFS